MKKLFSIVLFAFVANCVAFAWNGDGGLANPVRVWSNPVIYSYDEEVTWYYDFADANPAQLEGATLAIWIWQPSNIADPGPYGNEPDYASETDGSPVAPSLPDVNKKLILTHCGGTVYSITLTPTEFFGKTEEEIVANTEGGYWHHVRLFDAAGNCITNCGAFPILFPHQILLGTQGLASAAVAEFGGVNDLVEFTVFPSDINATTPIAFILNNDEIQADWGGTSLHFVSGINGWSHKVDYNWDDADASKCKQYFGFDDIYVFNVTNPSAYYGVDYDYEIDDIQFLFTPFQWASPVVLESEWEFYQVTPFDPPTGTINISLPNEKVTAYIAGNDLIVNQPSFDLYSISGVRVAQTVNSTLNIAHLPSAVYIVKTAKGSAKIMK